MTILEAMTDGLTRMARVLDARKAIDADLVRDYLFVIQDDYLDASDVEQACAHFCRTAPNPNARGSGFPTGPMLRDRALHEKWLRESRMKAEKAYAERVVNEGVDLEASEGDREAYEAESRKIVQDALARMERGLRRMPDMHERPRDVRRDIRRLRESGNPPPVGPSDTSKAGDRMESDWGGR